MDIIVLVRRRGVGAIIWINGQIVCLRTIGAGHSSVIPLDHWVCSLIMAYPALPTDPPAPTGLIPFVLGEIMHYNRLCWRNDHDPLSSVVWTIFNHFSDWNPSLSEMIVRLGEQLTLVGDITSEAVRNTVWTLSQPRADAPLLAANIRGGSGNDDGGMHDFEGKLGVAADRDGSNRDESALRSDAADIFRDPMNPLLDVAFPGSCAERGR